MYRVKSTGEIKSQGEIRRMYPNTSFPAQWSPELVESLELDPVLETPAPPVTRYQSAVKNGVVQDADGNWVWAWTVSDMSEEAKAALDASRAASVRTTRNQLISGCDWTQLADAPITEEKKALWAAYRQALRDIPAQAGFPFDIEWPNKP